MSSEWPALSYRTWRATCDTLHAHTQVLGKLAAKLAPAEPQLQHAALRLTARGWRRRRCLLRRLGVAGRRARPARPRGGGRAKRRADRAGRAHARPGRRGGDPGCAGGRPPGGRPGGDRPDAAGSQLAGAARRGPGARQVRPGPGGGLLYGGDPGALVLAAFRAPYRGRSTPVNAWWGSFDLAVSLFSGSRPTLPPRTSSCATRWTRRRCRRLVAQATGVTTRRRFTPTRTRPRRVRPAGPVASAARWDAGLGEYILDTDDIRSGPDPAAAAPGVRPVRVPAGLRGLRRDMSLAASADGTPPPVR